MCFGVCLSVCDSHRSGVGGKSLLFSFSLRDGLLLLLLQELGGGGGVQGKIHPLKGRPTWELES